MDSSSNASGLTSSSSRPVERKRAPLAPRSPGKPLSAQTCRTPSLTSVVAALPEHREVMSLAKSRRSGGRAASKASVAKKSVKCRTCGARIRIPDGWTPGPAVRKHYWAKHRDVMLPERGAAR